MSEILLGEIIEKSAKVYGKKAAIIFEGKEIAYNDVEKNVNRFANALLKSGIKKGDVVAIMLPNIPEFIYTYFGVQRIGAVAVPMNPMFKGGEIIHVLNDSGAKIMVTLASFISTINEVRPEVPNLQKIIITGERDINLADPASTIFVQMVYDAKDLPGLEKTYQKIGEALTRVFKEFKVKDVWYKHWGGVRVGGKKIAGFSFGQFGGEDVIIMNAICFIGKLVPDDFFKVIWVPKEIKDNYLEPLTSIEEQTGNKPAYEEFKDVVAGVFQDILEIDLEESNELSRDEKFGYQKQKTLVTSTLR